MLKSVPIFGAIHLQISAHFRNGFLFSVNPLVFNIMLNNTLYYAIQFIKLHFVYNLS